MVPAALRCALVTGGTGYIGSMLTDFLRRAAGVPEVLSTGSTDLDVCDRGAVADYLADHKPDVVFHLAAKADTDWCEAHFEEARAVNVDGTLNVVQAGLDAGARIVYFSSGCLYPDDGQAHAEGGRLAARCRYSETKLLAEDALKPYESSVLIVRARQPFSNHEHPRNLLTKLAGYTRFIDEQNSMSHLEECLPVVWELAKRDICGPINITNEGTTTPHRIAQLIKQHRKPKMKIEKISHEELLREVQAARVNCIVDCARLRGLGITLRPVEDAVLDCIEHPCRLGDYDWWADR